MKRVLSCLLAVLLVPGCVSLTACSRYVSHYKAVGFVHSNESDTAFMNFYSFEGAMVFRLKYKGGSPGQLRCTAKLETGSADVSYDEGGTLRTLCTVSAGDPIDDAVDLQHPGTVYVIVKTSEPCKNGELQFAVAASSDAPETERDDPAEISRTELDTLMQQAAARETSGEYASVLPCQAFADAEVFSVDRNGGEGRACVYLYYAEYVVLKGKAYDVSGGAGAAVLRFRDTESGPELLDVTWSADGDLQDDWLRENFPAGAYKKYKAYDAYTAEGKNALRQRVDEAAAKTLGVPVETDDLLSVDTESGTYEVCKVTPTDGGRGIDTEVIDAGSLRDTANTTNSSREGD